MPPAPSTNPDLEIDWNILRQTGKLMGYARERHDVFWAVIGASWFWFVGTVLLVQFPVFTKDILLANEDVANAFIATFTIGIGLGSMITNLLLKGEVSAKYVPVAAIMMTLFLIDLYFAAGQVNARLAGTTLNGVGVFFADWASWRVAFDLFMTAFFGGIYAVPLNAIMQTRASPPKRSRVIAANNVINAIFMISATVASVILLQFISARACSSAWAWQMPWPPSGFASSCPRKPWPILPGNFSASSTALRSGASKTTRRRAAGR